MVNPKLYSPKLVIPAALYHRRKKVPESWHSVLKDANYSILISGRTGCLSGDTVIETAGGKKKIKHCGRNLSVKSYNLFLGRFEFKPAIKIDSGTKNLFRCVLNNAKEIVCSEDHKFFVLRNSRACEIKLLELSPGDKILQQKEGVESEHLEETQIASIEPLGNAESFDLKVADNHNFFLGNGILTHNSGKDSLTTYIMDLDLDLGRTVIVLDTKMEYPCAIFCQQDVVLRNILLRNGLVGKGYPVILWIPYVEGLERNQHFKELLGYHHPNLEIRPFRIRIQDFASEDSYNMSLAKTHLQAAADKTKLVGQSKMLNEARDEIGRRMGFDDESVWRPGCGWEYMDLEEATTNKKVNVVSTFFMSKNSITATSYMIGLLNDFLTIGKSINRVRAPHELFTITIPEVEIILPRGVKSLDQIVNTLRFSMRMGLKLMRSFGVRFRMNLQNLSALDPDMVSQSVPFAGRTWNPKDLNMLGIFGLSRQRRLVVSRARIGQFFDVIHNKEFSAVPFSHKAREMEYFVTMMRQYYRDPSLFLFETENYFLSEILDYQQFFYEGKPLTVTEYNLRVRAWLASKKPRKVMALSRAEFEQTDLLEDAVEFLGAMPS